VEFTPDLLDNLTLEVQETSSVVTFFRSTKPLEVRPLIVTRNGNVAAVENRSGEGRTADRHVPGRRLLEASFCRGQSFLWTSEARKCGAAALYGQRRNPGAAPYRSGWKLPLGREPFETEREGHGLGRLGGVSIGRRHWGGAPGGRIGAECICMGAAARCRCDRAAGRPAERANFTNAHPCGRLLRTR
jgi:hypothetical protein